jgi:uncharacterized membrane protein (UPF0127 family)
LWTSAPTSDEESSAYLPLSRPRDRSSRPTSCVTLTRFFGKESDNMIFRSILRSLAFIDHFYCFSIELCARLARRLNRVPSPNICTLRLQQTAEWVSKNPSPLASFEFVVVIPRTRRTKATGLLNHSHLDENSGLLLCATRHVHSFGMNFSATILFLDRNLCVLGSDLLSPNMVRSGPTGTRFVLEIAPSYAGVSKSWRGIHFGISP